MFEKFSFKILPVVFSIVVILLATLLLAKIAKITFNRAINRGKKSSNYDPTGLIFAKRCIVIIIYMFGSGLVLAKIPEFKIVGHSLLAGAGVMTIIAGLASQQFLSNIMSGILIVIFKPFKLGDRVTVDGKTGSVEDINLRQFVLRDIENNRIIIPNSIVGSNAIVNFHHTDMRCCKTIEIGIGYGSDIDKALSIMVTEVLNHPLHIDGRTQEQIDKGTLEVIARVVGLEDSSVALKVWAWAKDSSDGFILNCDLFKSIKQKFDSEGIEIPFPQRTITYTNTEKNY